MYLRCLVSVACFLGLLSGFSVTSPQAAAREPEIQGVVLAVLAARHEVVVRDDHYPLMSATTTVYRVGPDSQRVSLRPGDRIMAYVNDGRPLRPRLNPPELNNIRLLESAPPTPPPVLRNVVPLVAGDRIPATRFTDQNGRAFTFADFIGKDVVLAFIYTRCRDARECPLISSNFHWLQQRIGTKPYRLVEITLDPSFDRPAVLQRYAQGFDADPHLWTFGTGDPNAVLDFEARFGIDPFPDARVGLIHTERTVLIDRDGKIVDFIDEAGWSTDGVLARLAAMESAPENPLARLDYELSKAAVAVCGNGVAGFSGLGDLAIVLLIIGGAAWLLFRVGRILREQV